MLPHCVCNGRAPGSPKPEATIEYNRMRCVQYCISLYRRARSHTYLDGSLSCATCMVAKWWIIWKLVAARHLILMLCAITQTILNISYMSISFSVLYMYGWISGNLLILTLCASTIYYLPVYNSEHYMSIVFPRCTYALPTFICSIVSSSVAKISLCVHFCGWHNFWMAACVVWLVLTCMCMIW